MSTRPPPDEYDPYYGRYISLVPDGDIVALLGAQLAETLGYVSGLTETRGAHRYAPGKWSVKEVIGHVTDTERIMSYRALRIARGDATPLPGYEQDDYVRGTDFDRRTLRDLMDELTTVRQATLSLVRSLTPAELARRGSVNDGPMSPRALAYIIAGHERYHLAMLRERYG